MYMDVCEGMFVHIDVCVYGYVYMDVCAYRCLCIGMFV